MSKTVCTEKCLGSTKPLPNPFDALKVLNHLEGSFVWPNKPKKKPHKRPKALAKPSLGDKRRLA